MKALLFSTFGNPSVLHYKEVPDADVSAGELLVQIKAIGLNYADVYHRQGAYHLKGEPPFIAGYEGAGVLVTANGVDGFKPGDPVCVADVPFANTELVAVPVDHAIHLPHAISIETAAAVLLQGLTAHYLTHDSHPIKSGDTVLIQA